jgi:hypothetical protein
VTSLVTLTLYPGIITVLENVTSAMTHQVRRYDVIWRRSYLEDGRASTDQYRLKRLCGGKRYLEWATLREKTPVFSATAPVQSFLFLSNVQTPLHEVRSLVS